MTTTYDDASMEANDGGGIAEEKEWHKRERRDSKNHKSNTLIDVTSEWLVSEEGGGQTTLTCLGQSDRQTKIRKFWR